MPKAKWILPVLVAAGLIGSLDMGFNYQSTASRNFGAHATNHACAGYPRMAGLTSLQTIRITGNGEFTSFNGVVSGSGQASDPFIIANWSINAATWGEGACINIADTTAYFIIKNCFLNDTSNGYYEDAGVYLDNVVNGVVENNTCSFAN